MTGKIPKASALNNEMAIKFFEPFTEEKFCTIQLQLKNLPVCSMIQKTVVL